MKSDKASLDIHSISQMSRLLFTLKAPMKANTTIFSNHFALFSLQFLISLHLVTPHMKKLMHSKNFYFILFYLCILEKHAKEEIDAAMRVVFWWTKTNSDVVTSFLVSLHVNFQRIRRHVDVTRNARTMLVKTMSNYWQLSLAKWVRGPVLNLVHVPCDY